MEQEVVIHLTDGPNRGNELGLDSTIGNHIPNEQGGVLPSGAYDACETLVGRYLDQGFGVVKKRGIPTARYNCHGLTFACRRTGIFEDSAVFKLMQEDGFQKIDPASALPGDIVLYFDDRGTISHSAVVVGGPTSANLMVPLVVSKWRFCAEVVHPANVGPYDFGTALFFRSE